MSALEDMKFLLLDLILTHFNYLKNEYENNDSNILTNVIEFKRNESSIE
jgi:hypothetical protein